MDHLTIGLPNSLPGLALGLTAFLMLGVLGLVLHRAPARRHAWAESVLVASLICAALLLAPLRRPLQLDALGASAAAAPEPPSEAEPHALRARVATASDATAVRGTDGRANWIFTADLLVDGVGRAGSVG